MRIVLLIAFTLYLSSFPSAAQNLPSLILNRNINATFSIIAYDTAAREWGIAVASNNIYVGNSTCYLQPGTGAFSVIAETEPAYGLNGLLQLQQGKTIEQAVRYTRDRDSLADYRQVAGIDSAGNVFAFTGTSLRNWKGVNTHLTGKHFAVMGNQLAPGTLPAMATAFENTCGSLATRLRVDHSPTPFTDLERLLQYHYGRITLNQALYALNNQQTERGKNLLQKAITQTEGWYGIYSRIAKAWLLLNDTLQAIHTLKAAMAAEPKWKENLPAFYCLYAKEKSFAALYPESNFTIADWNNAISMLSALRQPEKAALLAQQITRQYLSSSYTWYLLACAWQQLGQLGKAMQANTRALQNDPENADALRLKALLALDLKKS